MYILKLRRTSQPYSEFLNACLLNALPPKKIDHGESISSVEMLQIHHVLSHTRLLEFDSKISSMRIPTYILIILINKQNTYKTGNQKYFLCTGVLVSRFCTVKPLGLLLEILFGTRISRIYFDTLCVLCHPVEFLLSFLLLKNVVTSTKLFKRPILQL